MKKIGIVSNNNNKRAQDIAKTVYDYLRIKKIDVFLPSGDLMPERYSLPSVESNKFIEIPEIIISVGGDGTFLRASKYSFKNEIPVLGINVGNLGFLTEVDTENIKEAMNNLINGSYHLEKRMLLEGHLIKNNISIENPDLPGLALNEFAITRSNSEKVIKIEINVNGIFIKKFSADGIIIATPTGSTAYSLSAGGPVVEPKAETMIITPICAHTLFSRSIILGPNNLLEVKLNSSNKKDMISVDGKSFSLEGPSEYVLRVIKSDKKLNLVSFNPNAFFKVFKEKFIERI
jgi:NAD+ kinase